jgi:hypothetical protein
MAGDTLVIVGVSKRLMPAGRGRPTVVFALKDRADSTVAGRPSPLLGMRSLDERILCNHDKRG